jgi:hypothetical protein
MTSSPPHNCNQKTDRSAQNPMVTGGAVASSMAWFCGHHPTCHLMMLRQESLRFGCARPDPAGKQTKSGVETLNSRTRRLLSLAIPGLLILASPVLVPAVARPAFAQGADLSGIGWTDTSTVHATVTAIDRATRKVTLTNPQGRSITFTAGPEIRRLSEISVGDKVQIQQVTSVTYVLSPHGVETPPDNAAVAAVRTTPGELPGGAIGAETITSGVVVAVDPEANTISLVDPSGGLVHVIHVKRPAAQAQLASVEPGDRITAIFRDIVVALVGNPS